MTVQEAKETVVLAGRRLVESGLIARTWGNISCRISSTHFVITPSGRDYISLTPEEIVEVAISDCSYTGNVKPSSEKGIHAEVYQLHPEVNFVIHTHQDHASAISVLNVESIRVSNDYPTLQGEVLCADYGLPGTKKLRRNVAAALAHSKGKAVIMKNHGALCFGENTNEAFQVAQELEDACENYVLEQYHNHCDKMNMDPVSLKCMALSQITRESIFLNRSSSPVSCESEKTEQGFRLHIQDKVYDILSSQYTDVLLKDQQLLAEVQLHKKVYESQPDISHILHTTTSGILAVSCAGMTVLPLLDDFAQIAGTCVKTVPMEADKTAAALKSSPVVFLKDNGALCCGSTQGDAQAVSLVTEKNSNALVCAALFGKVKYIRHLECMLMRFVYLKKYSRQAYK